MDITSEALQGSILEILRIYYVENISNLDSWHIFLMSFIAVNLIILGFMYLWGLGCWIQDGDNELLHETKPVRVVLIILILIQVVIDRM